MKISELKKKVSLGEDSRRQFKADLRNADSLAAEIAAFANSEGGVIFIGVADDGSLPGLSNKDVSRINQLISNTASQHVRSPVTVQTENIEELRRLFQSVDQFHADELPTKAGADKLDKLRFRDFLRDIYHQEFPDDPQSLIKLLQNMNLAADNGMLNLAGVLLFAEKPEWIKPQFIVKAIRYPGNDIHSTTYLDTEDFCGSLEKIFADSLAFIMRNLHKVQAGRGVNAPGVPEIPESVFEELLVNALVHRDYLVSAPIRIFIFDNRIEIISPGHLPNNLTVEKILAGNFNIRNPILVSYIAKGLLPYKGIGSGIRRALDDWQKIDFIDDRDGCVFTVTVHRTTDNGSVKNLISSEKIILQRKSSEKILGLLRDFPEMTISQLAKEIGISTRAIEKQIAKL